MLRSIAARRAVNRVAKNKGESQEIGEALLVQTKEVFRLWQQVTEGTVSRRKFQKLIVPVKQRVTELLDQGSACGHRKTRGRCRQIRMVAAALWTFVRVCAVEPTNNAAERSLRRAV